MTPSINILRMDDLIWFVCRCGSVFKKASIFSLLISASKSRDGCPSENLQVVPE